MRTLTLAHEPIDIDNLRIASPCDQDFSKMPGDERKRFCDACSLHVYNVEALTRREVESLVEYRGLGGRVCMHLLKRKDGTVITQDCPVGLAEKAWRKARNGSLVAAASLLTAISFMLTLLFTFSQQTMAAPQRRLLEPPPAAQKIEQVRAKIVEQIEQPYDGGI